MPTIAEAIKNASQELRAAGVPNDVLDAQTLLAFALGKDRTYLIIQYNQPLTAAELTQYQALIARRCSREPLQYITGRQEFFGLEFAVNRSVLIPRPETELIIEEVIRLSKAMPDPLMIDVGTGSGCIAVTVARELTAAKIIALDISSDALAVARHNAEKNDVDAQITFLQSDLMQALLPNCKADFILSNPPYISLSEFTALQLEVRDWEPRQALTDESNGLRFYEALLSQAPAHLKQNGYLIFEMGYQQAAPLRAMVDGSVWQEPKTLLDLQGIERTMILQKR